MHRPMIPLRYHLALSSGKMSTSLENAFSPHPLSALLSTAIHVCRRCRIFWMLYSLNTNHAYLPDSALIDPFPHGQPSDRMSTCYQNEGCTLIYPWVPLVKFKFCTSKIIKLLSCAPRHTELIATFRGVSKPLESHTWRVTLLWY